MFFLTVFQILLGSHQKHYLFYLDLARLRVAGILKANIFNGPAASHISDDSMVNSFVTHSLQMTLLQAPCRFLVQGSVGQADTLQGCSEHGEEYKDQHIHLTFLLKCETGDL